MASALRQRRRGESANSPSPEGYAGKMPLYALGVNNRGFAVAGGGGGASKTGIPNGLIFFKYNQEKIEKIGEHHTSADAITSLDIHPEENLALFVDTDKFATVQFAAGGTVLKTETVENSIASRVKVLRFSPQPSAARVVLGCFDGALNVVSYPALTTIASAPQAHTDDIDDVCWDPTSKLIATTSKDKTAKVWKVEPGLLQVAQTLKCEADGAVLVPRGCRFSPSTPSHLFVSAFVVSKATYIFVWNSETGSLIRKAKIHNYHSASFAMSNNGAYVAVGDVDGTIVVAEAVNLQKVLQVKPHGFFVPALAFTPPPPPIKGTAPPRPPPAAAAGGGRGGGSASKKRENRSATAPHHQQQQQGAVISVGADYACMFTPIIHQSFVNKQLLTLLVGFVVLLLAVFIKLYQAK